VKIYAIASAVLIVLGSISLFYSLDISSSQGGSDSAPIPLGSPQWAGFVSMSNLLLRQGVATKVSGSWIVPAVSPSQGDAFSAIWVGIGGYGENSLIQTGTLQGYRNGGFTYYAWYELLPNTAIRIQGINVEPGDEMTASVSLVDANQNSWLIEINDVTTGESFSKTVVYNSARLSAEWIVERPTISGNISDLASFGSVTFADCQASIGGITGNVSGFPGYQLVMYDGQTQLVKVSALSGGGSSFTIDYIGS
jgi:Peptidase A4 family